MERDAASIIIGLIVSGLAGAGALVLLLRGEARRPTRRAGFVQGYPARQYPARDIVDSAPLNALALTQTRLLTLYEQVPQQSDLAIWLATFLRELRAIMDVAYRVASISRMYGVSEPLDRVVSEIQAIETQIASCAMQQLLHREADTHLELLDGRLATLRLCADELAHLSRASASTMQPR